MSYAERKRALLGALALGLAAWALVLSWRLAQLAGLVTEAPPKADAALSKAQPELLAGHYQPAVPPEGLGQDPPVPPALPLQRWDLVPDKFRGPLAWCPATGKLAFYRDGWIWITDAQGSRLRTLWSEPDLAAGGQMAWSPDGSYLWIRADGWRRWFSLELGVDRAA